MLSPPSVAVRHLLMQANSPLAIGALILFVVVLIVVGGLFGAVRIAMIQGTGQSEGPSPDELTNCPDCGARTPLSDETCTYCDQPLSESAD